MWWVFNDKGNIHTETGGDPIGMEIRAQAFAFATNDEVNSMTFYNYELINRSYYTLNNTYFAIWVDSDIGCSEDDFVGCDVQRHFVGRNCGCCDRNIVVFRRTSGSFGRDGIDWIWFVAANEHGERTG